MDVWNLVLGCLMWTVWKDWNRCSCEDIECSLDQLKSLFGHTLLDWSRACGSSHCFDIFEFIDSLRSSI